MQLNYHGIISETSFVDLELQWSKRDPFPADSLQTCEVPEGVNRGAVPEVYAGYRQGLHGACCDKAIVTRQPNGKPAIMLSLRKKSVCFGGVWWIYGGAIHAYRDIAAFVSERAASECGVEVPPHVLIGVYMTNASDHIGSTMQPCFASFVPYDTIMQKMRTDSGHGDVRLFTTEELRQIPESEQHWYPMRIAHRTLESLPVSLV